MFQDRVKACGLHIDRSVFYPIMDKNILQLTDGLHKIVNREEHDKVVIQKTRDGINTITEIKYEFDKENNYINITKFKSLTEPNSKNNTVHDMRKGNIVFKSKRRGKISMLV